MSEANLQAARPSPWPNATSDLPSIPTEVTTPDGQQVALTLDRWAVRAQEGGGATLTLDVGNFYGVPAVLRTTILGKLFLAHSLRTKKAWTVSN